MPAWGVYDIHEFMLFFTEGAMPTKQIERLEAIEVDDEEAINKYIYDNIPLPKSAPDLEHTISDLDKLKKHLQVWSVDENLDVNYLIYNEYCPLLGGTEAEYREDIQKLMSLALKFF